MVDRFEKLETDVDSLKESRSKIEFTVEEHHKEINALREAKHKLFGIAHTHKGLFQGVNQAIDKISEILTKYEVEIKNNREAFQYLKVMISTAVAMGAFFISFCVFVANYYFKWF